MLDVARPVKVAAPADVPHEVTTHLRDSTIKRGHTISGVTAEAGAVFEHLLRRSHSDSSSHSRRVLRTVSRRPLTTIIETNDSVDVGRRADESADNWTTDITLDSIDTRLSSCNGLDDVDVGPSRNSVQSGDQFSRDSIDFFESKRSSGTRLSSDRLDNVKFSSTQSHEYFQQSSRNSSDLLASLGASRQHTAEDASLGSMSVELTDDVSVVDADDERKRKEKTKKKKKSVFQRVRERLRATFSRDEDRHRASHKADKYMHPERNAGRQNWLTASFHRKRNKRQTDHVTENGSTAASSHLVSSSGQLTDRDQHKSKGLLSSLHRRFSSVRVKRSQSHGSVSSSTQMSQSGDETNIRPLSESQQRILSRYATSEAVREPMSTVTSSMHSRQGHHSIRATLELDIRQPVRPAADGTAGSEAVVVDVEPTLSSDLEERVRDWDFIDGAEQQLPPLQHATSRRFTEKSPAEKDELYERIASQLMTIGDTYVISTPLHGDESAECAASQSAMNDTPDKSMDLSVVADHLASTATHSYSMFQSVVNEAIHGESGLQQIAFMFQLSRAAIEHAGTGTDLANSIKNMTMRYFEQFFAPWVVEQGGWESVVESTDSELD